MGDKKESTTCLHDKKMQGSIFYPSQEQEFVNTLESVSCRICKLNTITKMLNVKQTGRGRWNYFPYFFCENCQSLTISDIPNNLGEYYEGYYSYNSFNSEVKFNIKRYIRNLIYGRKILFKIFGSFYRSIYDYNLKSIIPLNLKKTDKILDIGSGSGKFVYDLYNLGYINAVGIDPFLEKTIKYENGAIVYKKDLSEIKEKYKLITFHHTFEHMENLSEACGQIAELLEDDGVCIIRIPNIDSFSFEWFQEFWTGIHAPYHINLPSKKAMKDLLGKNGLEITKISGEQTSAFFLANVENQLDVVDPNTMFVKFSAYCHTFLDKVYWKFKSKKVKKYPEKCEWLTYFIEKEKKYMGIQN